ncbi:MAG: transporter substrate-binding domain-containing protein, partial [Alphaproteobacteria bacterium]|nr:transporter substrate-binding domain-containing protein [Alphaproteobacteria bacterium]
THALRPEVYGPSDLSRVEVGTIAGGIGAKYLDKRHLNYQTFKTVPAALDSLESGKLKAIVFSEPVLRYQVKKNYAKTLKVLPNSFTSQYYVLITSKNSLLRLALNKAVFNMSYSEEWLDILHKYMGHVPSHH